MPELADLVTRATSRRGFIARVGALLVGAAGGSTFLAARPEVADAHHFCGHTAYTGSCPHPTGMPRVDAAGFPLRASDGKPVDDLGRVIDAHGRPVDARGGLLRDPDGQPLAPAPRTRICLDGVPERYGIRTHIDGSWYRCCGGHVRKLMDCCSLSARRVNGDASVTGYCVSGRRVFCVQYYDTKVPC